MCAWHDVIAALQARSPMTDEISSAVSDALTDTTPLGRDEGLLESTAQRFVDGEESSFRQPESGEESFRQPNSMQVGHVAPIRIHVQAVLRSTVRQREAACHSQPTLSTGLDVRTVQVYIVTQLWGLDMPISFLTLRQMCCREQ